MKQLSNARKAVAANGDDVTLTRFIKEPGRHKGRPTPLAPANATRTRFLTRVLPTGQMTSLLVSGHSNIKIGRDVRKGKLRGYWIYTLSLEERATCPSSCQHWRSCYGNAMPFAKRVDHTDPLFLPRLEAELARLMATRGRRGVLVRLHALGDFYSQAYVQFWRRMLAIHPTLAIYGYTARKGDIAHGITRLNHDYPEKCNIRFSDSGGAKRATVSIKRVEDCPPDAFVCPEQTDQTRCCATCGACWSTTKNVAFLAH
jgi:hypothetical protein